MQRTTFSTLVLIVLIGLIVVGCGIGGVAQAPEFTPTPTKTPKPTFTPTPEATDTPAPTDTPEPTVTPEVTDTPAATDTPELTETPEATETPPPAPTNTTAPQPTSPPPPPPTNTPPPPPTNTPPPPFPFQAELVQWEPNCAGNQVKGFVRASTGDPVNGGVVKVNLYGNIVDAPVGPQYSALGNGGYDWARWGQGLLEAPITVALHSSDGQKISNDVTVDFTADAENCEPGESGHQVATVNFTCVRPDVCG